MIYPDDYKCLTCNKRNTYGCRYRSISGMLSCFDYVVVTYHVTSYPRNLSLMRCLLGICPQKLVKNGFI